MKSPPHSRHMLSWPSSKRFNLDDVYVVCFDPITWYPLTPVCQMMHGGIVVGLEMLYPLVPWVEINPDDEVTRHELSGHDHKHMHQKMLANLKSRGHM